MPLGMSFLCIVIPASAKLEQYAESTSDYKLQGSVSKCLSGTARIRITQDSY